MKAHPETSGRSIDRAVTEIRDTQISSDQVRQAAERVRTKLIEEHNKVVVLHTSDRTGAGDRIANCSDFQNLMPAYLSSSLSSSRRMLLEDHLAECAACRRALSAARGQASAPHVTAASMHRGHARIRQFVRWSLAAAAVLILAFTQMNSIRDFIFPIDVHAVAQAVNGGLYRVNGQEARPVAAGERIGRSEAVRTGNDSDAVLELADGSEIEMNSRSEVSLERGRDGVRIQLNRGSVIVTAAKQRTGHLYVATPDCSVSVVGTVFSVNTGTKGSRVSVIEGEVHVQNASESKALHPGQQFATTSVMGAVPLEEEIAWSRDRDLHLALLKEVVNFTQDLGQRLGSQEMRHTSNLAHLVPASTVVFATLPNVSQPLADSYALMKQRISENAPLQQWWNKSPDRPDAFNVDEMIDQVTRVGSYLGPEIVLSVSGEKDRPSPLLLADVDRPAELSAALHDAFSRIGNMSGAGNPNVQIAHNPPELAAIGGSRPALVIYVDQNFMAVSGDPHEIERVLARRARPDSEGFTSTALYQRVSQAYGEGVGWLLAADLKRMGPADSGSSTIVGDVQQLVIEQKTGSGGASYRAVLGFNQARAGVAGWLASPGPLGATEFLSPGAYGAAGVVLKDPTLIVDDIFKMLQKDGRAWQELQSFEQNHHVDIRHDLASPLGNEVLFALDGPILPAPAWKLVVEVNDAARLQNTLEWGISEINRESTATQGPELTMSTEMAGGRAYYTIRSASLSLEAHYTFWGGYMIAAPSRSMLEEAIEYHDTGNSLARTDHFRSQLPFDGKDNASGFVYQNLQTLANAIPVEGVRETVAHALPTLVCLYGEPDKIVASSNGVLGTNIAAMAGLNGMIQAIGIK